MGKPPCTVKQRSHFLSQHNPANYRLLVELTKLGNRLAWRVIYIGNMPLRLKCRQTSFLKSAVMTHRLPANQVHFSVVSPPLIVMRQSALSDRQYLSTSLIEIWSEDRALAPTKMLAFQINYSSVHQDVDVVGTYVVFRMFNSVVCLYTVLFRP